MFTWESAIFNGVVSGTSVAAVGVALNLDANLILFGVSIAGSMASVGFRWMAGFLVDWKQRCMAFITGVLVGTTAIPYLSGKGLVGLEASIFVLAISLIGARAVKFLSTDFDVGEWLGGILDKISKKDKQ